jgi:hypothetical protein
MFKSLRPEIAEDIAQTQANLEYRQMTTAQKADRTMSAQQRLVSNMKSLSDLQKYAQDLSRNTRIKSKVQAIIRGKDFNHIGSLKLALLELWGDERTALHRRAVTSVEEQRKAIVDK